LPALLLLHEGLGSVGLWRGFPRALADATGHRTVLYSRFGHGGSEPPPRPRTPEFMHEEALEILPDVLDQLEIEEPVLIGHSDGASIALIYAASQPVHGIVALAPHVFVEERTLEGIRETGREFLAGDLRRRMTRHHEDPEVTFRGWCDVWLDPAFRDWNIEDVLDGIDAPLLLIQGADDAYGTLEQLDAIERGVSAPVQRLVVPGGHTPHLERPDPVLDAIVEFVAEVAG
jgi:pimeloyl-ACP methyl ester carboxylesterase